jgi:hypothetical protein
MRSFLRGGRFEDVYPCAGNQRCQELRDAHHLGLGILKRWGTNGGAIHVWGAVHRPDIKFYWLTVKRNSALRPSVAP